MREVKLFVIKRVCSDSSMDDCNSEFYLFVRRVLYCSDSSMDDCNKRRIFLQDLRLVFRFLYGRL